MKKVLTLALAFVLCLGSVAFASEAEEAPAVDYIQSIPYIDDGNEDHTLDVFGFEEGGAAKPVVLEIHGGGFFGGTKETNTAHSQFYADNGFAVVTPNYTHLPGGDFVNLFQEVFTVLHWIEDNAEEYHLDTNNLFVSGDSAGGFIVEMTALLLSNEELRQSFDVTAPSYTPKAWVLTCPKVDLMGDLALVGADQGFRSFAAERIEPVLRDEEQMAKVDLLKLIDPATYPEVYIVTTPDDAILYEEAMMFDEYLTEKNIPHELHSYESQENQLQHVFNISDVEWAESVQANTDIVNYLKSKMG